VLRKKDDCICSDNIASVSSVLEKRGMNVCRRNVGGMARRSTVLDIEKGQVWFTMGNSAERLLWQQEKKDTECR